MDNFFDNNRILTSIWKWKIHIIAVVAFATVVSAIISGPFFMPPKFKSTGRVYPVNLMEASEESESEHLMEYLQSTDIKFRMIDAFHLDEVYKISREENLYKTYILAEFNKNIKYKKTDFETIEISVMDVDPERAAKMVDSIIVYLNQAILKQENRIHLERAQMTKRDLEKRIAEKDSVFKIIEEIRSETGLIDYFTQSQAGPVGLMEAAARGGDRKPAIEMINTLVARGGELRKNQELLEYYEVAADTLKKRYDRAFGYGNQEISYSKVVEKPFIADKKAYPIRWLIVLFSVFATTIISVITVSLIDYIREIKSTL